MKRIFERSASGILVPRREPILPRKQRGFVCVNPYIGGSKSLTFQSITDDAVAGSSFTFASVAFGAESPQRRIHVAIHAEDVASGFSINTVSIAGVAGTINAQEGASIVLSGIATRHVPTGTTGTIIVVFSESVSVCSIGVWSSTGLASDVAVDSGTSTADPGTDTLSTSAGAGFVIAAWTHESAGSGMTISGISTNYNANTANFLRAAGSDPTTGANVSPSGDYSSGSANRSASFASF